MRVRSRSSGSSKRLSALTPGMYQTGTARPSEEALGVAVEARRLGQRPEPLAGLGQGLA